MSNQTQQTPGWGPPPQSPLPPDIRQPQRKRHIGRNIALAVIALFVLGGAISAISDGGTTATQNSVAPAATEGPTSPSADTGTAVAEEPTATEAPATTAKPAPKPKPKTLIAVNGTGSHTHATPKFTVPKNYGFKVYWSYKATGLFAGDSVNFIMTVEDPDATFSAADVNELDTHGSGVEEYGGEGTYFISVIAESSWTLKVVAVPNGCLLDSPPDCP